MLQIIYYLQNSCSKNYSWFWTFLEKNLPKQEKSAIEYKLKG